jgi:hypothetical protein
LYSAISSGFLILIVFIVTHEEWVIILFEMLITEKLDSALGVEFWFPRVDFERAEDRHSLLTLFYLFLLNDLIEIVNEFYIIYLWVIVIVLAELAAFDALILIKGHLTITGPCHPFDRYRHLGVEEADAGLEGLRRHLIVAVVGILLMIVLAATCEGGRRHRFHGFLMN